MEQAGDIQKKDMSQETSKETLRAARERVSPSTSLEHSLQGVT